MRMLIASAIAGIAFLSSNAISKAADETDAEMQTNSVIVAELFTSQSCSSCPPAEALFSELSEQENILAIEWHVDYWDKLVHGGSRWKDRYSSAVFTERQRAYNRAIRGTNGVYTPQAVVNGNLETVGSRSRDVSGLLQQAEDLAVPVGIENRTVTVGASGADADILFVRLLDKHVTDVKGGENKGRKLFGKNIVLHAEILGQTADRVTEYKLPSVGEGESCAVLVQTIDGKVGPILGAAKC